MDSSPPKPPATAKVRDILYCPVCAVEVKRRTSLMAALEAVSFDQRERLRRGATGDGATPGLPGRRVAFGTERGLNRHRLAGQRRVRREGSAQVAHLHGHDREAEEGVYEDHPAGGEGLRRRVMAHFLHILIYPHPRSVHGP